MGNDDRDDLVSEVADAVAWNQDVQWDRCARRANPAGRRMLDNLRALAPVFASPDTAGPRSLASATAAGPSAGVFARRAVNPLIAIAALEVAAALVLLPWRWDDYHGVHGDVAVYMAILLAGHGASAGLLLFAGRRDRRTWLLGGYFLFKATLAPLHMLPAFWGQMPPADMLQASVWEMPVPARLFLLLCGYPLAFVIAPALLWEFARECPRVHRRTALDDFARRMVPVSVAIGCAMCAGLASVYLAGLVGYARNEAVYIAVLDATIAAPNVLSLAAVVVIALRAHTAPAAEVRRVVLFGVGFLMWMGVATAYDLVEALSAGFWLSNYQSSSWLLLIQPLRFPGMILLWYSVLAVRVPHPREVARGGYRWLLLRRDRLWLLAAVPLAALGWLVASRPERAVGAVLADPLAQLLFALAGIMLLLLAGREELLTRLDDWVFPETADQRRVLASATATLAQAGQLATVSRTLTRTIKRGCGSPAALLLAGGTEMNGHDFSASDAGIQPLPSVSAIAHMLETTSGSLRVHPSDEGSVFVLLPPEDAAWVVETAADAIVPVPGPGTELIGILVVGRRFDDRTVRPVDIPFLDALGAAAGLAIARLRLLEAPAARWSEPLSAHECPVCRCVTGAGEPPGCDCGSAYVGMAAPKLLAGKYRLARRLGAGGMGAVYLARDLRLERDVAVKTLAGGVSVSRLMGLKPEAWAMAKVTHAAVAQIYAIESWRGRPFLVVEYLPGGTLADRLRRGPVPAAEAASVALVLGGALAALHREGYLHGDVKPSNIGFASNGSPKLLDFGLARETNHAETVGGTPRYMSPEVLSGRPAEEVDDVWSLCVVLDEIVSGRHPFAGGGGEVTDRIRRQRLVRGAQPSPGSELASVVLAFTASVLMAARPGRPATARVFTDALHRLVAKQSTDASSLSRAGQRT